MSDEKKLDAIRRRMVNKYRGCRKTQRDSDLSEMSMIIANLQDDIRRLQYLYDESGPGEFAA